MKKILAFLLTLLIVSTGNASMRDRLETIVSGDINIAVDTFIIGTHDRYIATIVREIDNEIIRDLSMTMSEMLNQYETNSVVIIERQVFDKNSKRYSLAERKLVIKSDLQTELVTEPLINSDFMNIEPGSTEELIWNGVAGPDGWGTKLLSEFPEPIKLSLDKTPLDAERYVGIARNVIGGIFLDRDSIKISEGGCSALITEAFNFDAEVHYGGMVAQYAYQPYIDALYAITASEFSFEKRAFKQFRFTVYGPNDRVIYSVRMPNNVWVTEDMDPIAIILLHAISRSLPENVLELLSNDVKSFEDYVQKRIEEAKKMQQEQEQERLQQEGVNPIEEAEPIEKEPEPLN